MNNNTRKFKLEKDYYEVGTDIFEKTSVEIKEGLTVLVGCNGAGKSTLLQIMETQLKDLDIPTISFDNLEEGGAASVSKANFYGNMDFLVNAISSSEGEIIRLNLGELCSKIGSTVRKLIATQGGPKELWVLLDAVDSGLSIDNVRELKKVFSLPMKDCESEGIALYIVVSANGYEMPRDEQCFDVERCRYITFKNYEDYADFIMASRERKSRRK